MPLSVLHDQIPHSIIFPNQPLFCLPPRVFGCVCFVHILTPGQDKLQTKPQGLSFSVILDFNKGITATLLIYIDTLSLPMSHFLRTLLCSLPPTLLVLMSSLYPFFIPSRIPHLYLRLLHLDHCRFILVARVLTPGLRLIHLLWCLPPRRRSCRLSLIFPLPFGKVPVPLINPILFIIS